MTIRTLPPEEYHRLAAVADGIIPPPDDSLVLVAENDAGEIVGRMFLVDVPHIEGTWVSPEARGGTVGARLERQMCRAAAALGLLTTFAFVTEPAHADYMKRLGWNDTGYTVLTKSLGGETAGKES